MEILRGGVYFARVADVGDRPVLVVSWNAVNAGLRAPVVCQITRRERERSLPTYVRLRAGEAGMADESYVLCHDLLTLGAESFRREVGFVTPATMVRVEQALKIVLDLG